ncbi:MAG TPA: Uma2 family endonuclease [Longimicrobium sp.]|nr:Uma2 family endonuclease [Longimicrobium sp.]
MATQAALVPDRISFEEFLTAYDGVRAEWVDGKVVEMSPASDPHQDVLELLAAALRTYVERTRAGITRSQQPGMRIGNGLRVPGLRFLSAEHRHRRTPTHIDGPVDFAVEVVSLESRLRDRDEKFHESEKAAIPEYWIIDPLRETVDLYRLGTDGRYHLADEGEPAPAGECGAPRVLDRSTVALGGPAADGGVASGAMAAGAGVNRTWAQAAEPDERTAGRERRGEGNGG